MKMLHLVLSVGVVLLVTLVAPASITGPTTVRAAPGASPLVATSEALPPLRNVAAVSAGGWHSCALTTSGGVKCWGLNAHGQVGDGTRTSASLPRSVIGLTSGVTAISAGGSHTCALTTAGAVKCWGRNAEGQLGDGTTTESLTPVDVVGLSSGVVAIAAGGYHTCALTAAGAVKCWGDNGYGAVGDGSYADRSAPVSVTGLNSGVAAIATGGYHTCAVTQAGAAKCWGSNDEGELGDGTLTTRPTPVAVSGLASGVRAIAPGWYHTCAVTTSGGVKCWGANWHGELGDGTLQPRMTPVNVIGLGGGVSAVGSGWVHTCALTTVGGVKCWGRGGEGQVGNGSTALQMQPVNVSGLSSGITALAVGGWHNCALTTAGTLKAWGEDGHDALGTGLTIQRAVPSNVATLASGVTAISGGDYHSCALTSSGGVKCWGWNWDGQLGDGTIIGHSVPANVVGLTSGVSRISVGGYHACAVTGGGAKCWGGNWEAQLGDGTRWDRTTPVNVSGLGSGVVAVAAGGYHTCALTTSGGVKCWGLNSSGQLGDGTTTSSTTPVNVSGLSSGVIAITAGWQHTCALTSAGAVKCWGSNHFGQLGDNSTTNRTTPVSVVSLSSGVNAIAAGRDHTCAVTKAGAVKCWGENGLGQLGNGATDDSQIPVSVVGLSSGASAVTGGAWHTCALTTAGGVKCWGDNTSGQLGNGTFVESDVPTNVAGLTSGATVVEAGYTHTCAVVGGAAKCWGLDSEGQLGLGTAVWRTSPVDVLDWLRRYLPVVLKSL